MKAIIVLAHCNLDDVICGVFEDTDAGRKLAMKRARQIVRNPELRVDANKFQQSNSEFLRAGVYASDGIVVNERIALIDHKSSKMPKKLERAVATAYRSMTGQPLGLTH